MKLFKFVMCGAHWQSSLSQLIVKAKQLLVEEKEVVVLRNPDKKFVLHIQEYSPRLKGNRKREIVCLGAWYYEICAEACEMRKQWQTVQYITTPNSIIVDKNLEEFSLV
ncbi:hypothetical protein ACTXT7_003136 [Hymenolepis weldensis]